MLFVVIKNYLQIKSCNAYSLIFNNTMNNKWIRFIKANATQNSKDGIEDTGSHVDKISLISKHLATKKLRNSTVRVMKPSRIPLPAKSEERKIVIIILDRYLY